MPNKHRTKDAACVNCGEHFMARLTQVGRFCSISCGAKYKMAMDVREAARETSLEGGERGVAEGRPAPCA